MSLLHPPPGFPAHLAMVWPLIWVQILALRAYVRATWGKGTKYHWSVTPYGRVFLTSLDWVPGQTEALVWAKPAAHPNARIAAALSGDLLIPDYARNPLIGAHPGEGRGPGRQALHFVALDPGVRRDERASLSLPIPDS